MNTVTDLFSNFAANPEDTVAASMLADALEEQGDEVGAMKVQYHIVKTAARPKRGSEAQKKATAERREAFRQLAEFVGKIPEDARAEIVGKHSPITNTEAHTLSIFNTCLLIHQRQNVTMVGGFQQWLTVGRCVRKGEKGLCIWVPCKGKKAEVGTTEQPATESTGTPATPGKSFFIAGTVFDISQTDPIEPK